jgi:hypothetical protein
VTLLVMNGTYAAHIAGAGLLLVSQTATSTLHDTQPQLIYIVFCVGYLMMFVGYLTL